MPLFMCSTCGCVENTAVSGYGSQLRQAVRTGEELRPRCSEHFLGAWHGRFPKRPATDYVQGSDGYLYTPAESLGVHAARGPFTEALLPA